MKNLILALSFFFVAGVSAQVKKATPAKAAVKAEVVKPVSNEEAAKKNVADMNAFTTLTKEQQNNFYGLFETKFRMLAEGGEAGLSAERKDYIAQIIERKLEASLDAATYEKIKANTTLMHSLTH